MFPFQKFEVYNKAKHYKHEISLLIKSQKIEEPLRSQINRASLSIVLNIAEGSGRFSKADRRNFFVIARSSIFECVAALDILLEEKSIDEDIYYKLLPLAEELSRMLLSLISHLRNSE